LITIAENDRQTREQLISRQALFGPFAAWEKGLAATRQCVLRKIDVQVAKQKHTSFNQDDEAK
jgi:hypothetical protein